MHIYLIRVCELTGKTMEEIFSEVYGNQRNLWLNAYKLSQKLPKEELNLYSKTDGTNCMQELLPLLV